MYTLLVVAVVLALLFDTAAASSPVMDPAMSAFGSEYPDPDGMLSNICDLCFLSREYCIHMGGSLPVYQIQQAPVFTPDTFLAHPEWPEADEFGSYAVGPPEPMPSVPFYPYADQDRQPLVDDNIRRLDSDATRPVRGTVESHINDTYTPGDRIAANTPRRTGNKRQPVRPRGFPCAFEGCGRIFDRSCDLKRHAKTHLVRSERPHKCSYCNEGFLYPKDRSRHERTHDQSTASQDQTFRCPVPGCTNVGFSRRDNLLRHQRKQHPQMGSPRMSP